VPRVTSPEADCSPAAELLVRLVNTRPNDAGRAESLPDAAALTAWLADVGLGADLAVRRFDVFAAHELRDALATVFQSHCGCEVASIADAEAVLADFAARHPLAPRLTADGCVLVPAQSGVPGAFGAVLAAAAGLAAQGHWPRLKLCKNATCHTAFEDKTKNLAGQFCGPACASQFAMRAYRSRRRSG
jgi:predicted RNA-binding Zn ribbon-like protein